MILLVACIEVSGVDTQIDVALSDGDAVLLTVGSCMAWEGLQEDFLEAADALDHEEAIESWSVLPDEFWEFRVVGDSLTATHVLQQPTNLYDDSWVETFAGEGAALNGGWEGSLNGADVRLQWSESEPCLDAAEVVARPLYSYY